MNKNMLIIIAVVILVAIGGFAFLQNREWVKPERDPQSNAQDGSKTERTENTSVSGATPTDQRFASDASSVYTIAEVAKHNTPASCWSAINGGVYDLTGWIDNHPGGEQAIMNICGKDGSTAFNGKHGEQEKPKGTLAGFKIGELK